MPLPLALLSTVAPGLWQVGAGIIQGGKSNRVKLQDTRPESFREELALNRQRAASQLMPGQKTAESRLQQNFANAAAAMRQTGTGASGLLAGLGRLNQQANYGSLQLADRAAAYQDQARNQLVGSLRQDAAYRKQDQQSFEREKAALKQASAQNLFGGLSTLGSVGAYAAGGGFDKNPETGLSPLVSTMNAAQQPQMQYQPQNGGVGYDPNQMLPTGIGQWGRLRNLRGY